MTEFLQQLVNGVTQGSVYALIALGYTMVYGILRLINFAHGDVYMLGAFFGYYGARFLAGRANASGGLLDAAIVLLAAMIGCGIVGWAIERFAYKPVRRSSRLAALITAIGVSLLLENGGQLVFGTDPKFFPQIIPLRHLRIGELTITNQQLIILGVSLGLMLLLRFVVMNTKVGKAMRAVSHNHDAAALMGISVGRIISITFVIGSMLAAAAGVLVALKDPRIEPYMGVLPGIKAFVAAVLGGIGNIPGAVLGGMVMGIAEVLVVGYVSPTLRDAIAFVLLIVILLVRPAGLLGTRVTEKV
jgi:branched-chain amino acid transport system permease protein